MLDLQRAAPMLSARVRALAVIGGLMLPGVAFASEGKTWYQELAPILILLVVVGFVIARLPKVEGLNHSPAFRRRRVLNWLPLGLTYAFLYMGRYNIKVSQHAFGDMAGPDGSPLMANADFATIFFWGTLTYGASFILNGPLTDRFGGKKAILTGAGGAAVANLLMGVLTWQLLHQAPGYQFIAEHFVLLFSLLYSVNMYFQSFGAVAIVKVNAPWFHVNERGVFGAIFGILISLGIYFAYDWGAFIVDNFQLHQVFVIPAVILGVFLLLDVFLVKESPRKAGLEDFDLADASSTDFDVHMVAAGQTIESIAVDYKTTAAEVRAYNRIPDGVQPAEGDRLEIDRPRLGVWAVFTKMAKNPVIVTIALIEFCSGFLRQAIMQWYRTFAKQTDLTLGLKGDFVYENWGLLLCCAGILGGVTAGIISDKVFQSRRGPVAGILYAGMLLGGLLLVFTYQTQWVGWIVVLMSMFIIGVHGMLSGTASMDFGGRKNVGVAVGIIDGFVYAGTAFMSILYAFILPQEELDEAGRVVGAATDPANWIVWPISMIPVALVGMLLASRVWNSKPKGRSAGH